MEPELASVIQRAQIGDKEAFGQLYSLYYARIFRFIYYLVYDHELAKDLTQTCFLKTWKSLPGFSLKKGTLQAFIFAVARNLVVDYQRKKKELTLDVVADVPSREDILKAYSSKEQTQVLYTVLLRLKKFEKQLIVLRYFEELSFKEIAQVVNRDERVIRVRVHRILRKLKQQLEVYVYEH